MGIQYTNYALLPLASAAILAMLAVFALQRRPTRGAMAFAVLMLAGCFWKLAYALEILAVDPGAKLLWAKVEVLGTAAVPVAWLTLALSYAGSKGWQTWHRRLLVLLAVVPMATLALAWTNGASGDPHGLMWSSVGLDRSGPFVALEMVHGPWYWVHVAYSYALLFAGTVVLVWGIARSSRLYYPQALALLGGAFVSWGANVAHLLGLHPVSNLNPGVLAFPLTGVLFALGLFRLRLLDLSPVARDAAFEDARAGLIVADAQDRVVDLNPAAQQALGCNPADVLGRNVSEVVPARLSLSDATHRVEEDDRQEVVLGEAPGRRYDRMEAPLKGGDGRQAGTLISLQDVTERRQVEEALAESEARFRTLVQNASDVVTILENDGTIAYESPAAKRVLGYGPEDLVGQNPFSYVHPDDREHVISRFAEGLKSSGTTFTPVEYRIRHADGTWRHLESIGNNLLHDPAIRGVIVNSRDVTERKILEERLEHQALHDHLTGLPNRALFTERLEQVLYHAGRRGTKIAVLFLDLDDFKYVNDTLGHGTGDRLLIALAGRLQGCVRPEDTVARLGGDEFAMLLEVEDPDEATRVAGRTLGALREPFDLAGREVLCEASVGVTLDTAGSGRPEDLLRKADLALYEAKRRGKSRHAIFNPEAERRSARRLKLENGLKRALERDEFTVRYQPVVSVNTGNTVGFEALARWEHPELGLIMPTEFVHLAEENGLIVPIGRWVLREACLRAREWQDRYPARPPVPPLIVSVNLSARQLSHPGLIGGVEEALTQAGLDPRWLTLEITESAMLKNEERHLDTLRRLKGLGVRLAIDDFGIGYSSLSYLRRLPAVMLKIDRSFIEELGREETGSGAGGNEVVLSGIVDIAQGLDMRVCAEGVETPEQLAYVKRLGCDLAQGLLFSEPLTDKAASRFLAGDTPA